MTAHSSWAQPRSSSYERLAFVGDSLLSQIVTLHLDRSMQGSGVTPGDMTRVRAQVVADSTLRSVAESIGLDRLAVANAPAQERENAERIVATGKPLASMFEALIAACWQHFGAEQTSVAVIDSLSAQIAAAQQEPLDEKSMLQELLARAGDGVQYVGAAPEGPPHQPTFEVKAVLESDGRVIGRGRGSSKKSAERKAAAQALESISEWKP